MKKARIIGPVLMIMLGLALVATPAQSAVDVGAGEPIPCDVVNVGSLEPCYPDPCDDVIRAHEGCWPDPCDEQQVPRAHDRCEPDPCDDVYYATAQVIEDDWCEPDPCDPDPQVDRAIDPCRPSIPPNPNVTTSTTEPETTTTEVPEETTTTSEVEETTTTVEETTTTVAPADVAGDDEGRRPPTATRGGALARTGAESGPLTAGGVALAGLGVALLVVERRRSAARA